MAANENSSISHHAIIEKLVHPLEEIRLRSLNSILLKLQYGLLQDSDLFNERQLFVNLLEWFNFPSVSRQDDVLKLLLRLSKHPVALDHLNAIEAVKFISDVRENQNEEHQKLVDCLLESLFLLPDEGAVNIPNKVLSVAPQLNGIDNVVNINDNEIQTVMLEDVGTSQTNPSIVHDRPSNAIPVQSNSGWEFSGFKLLSLKWIDVSTTDLHILTSTNNSLESNDSKAVSNSCNFLNDVLFKDFPPEIFLQHFQIVKNLLRLVGNSSRNSSPLSLKAVNCLLNLTKALITQINFCRDAALYNLKQSPNPTSIPTPEEMSSRSAESVDYRPSVIGQSSVRYQGDGQDGDASSSDTNNRLDPSQNSTDIPAITNSHTDEVGIPQYCVHIFLHSSSLLQSSNPKVLTAVIELLHLNCDLLSYVIGSNIWNDPSDLAQDITRKLIECYEVLTSSVMDHHKKCLNFLLVPSTNVKIHRLALLGITSILAKLLETSVTSHDISCINLPESCLSTLSHIVMDFLLAKCQPELHAIFLKYSQSLKQDCHLAHQSALDIFEALTAAFRCVKMWKDANCDMECSFTLALEALPCLDYYHYWEFVDYFIVQLSESVNKNSSPAVFPVLLKLMAYPKSDVRRKTYEKCLMIVKNSLGLHQISEVDLTHSQNIKFLLESSVLKQMVYFGLEDTPTDISLFVKEILLIFLQSKMLFRPEIWNSFLDTLFPFLPVLQAYTDTVSPFGIALFHLVDTDSTNWSSLTIFKANIRLLFSKDPRLRLQVIPRIAWFLAKENNAIYKHPSLSQFDVSTLANIFIQETKYAVPHIQSGNSYVQNINKLFQVFVSKDGGVYVRKAAGQQLVFLLNDPGLFQQFKLGTTYEHLFYILESCLTSETPASRQPPNTVELIPVVVEIIYLCLLKDNTLIEEVALKDVVYHTLLRVVLILKSDELVCRQVQLILASLLFPCCNLQSDNGTVILVVPFPVISQRCILPCGKGSNPSIGEHCLELPPVKFDNTETMHLFDVFMRFTWNVVFADGWEKFILLDSVMDTGRFSFNAVEKNLIKITRELLTPGSAFQEIKAAVSHKPVLLGVKTFSLQFLVVSLRNDSSAAPMDVDKFQSTFSRFLLAPPKSNADKTLLKTVLQFFNMVLSWSFPLGKELLEWMYSIFSLKNGALLSFLQKPSELFYKEANDEEPSSYSPLVKEVVTFLITLLSKTPYDEQYIFSSFVKIALSNIIQFILRHMNLAEAPQFYNLAFLEAVLQCLVHITARSGFSERTTNETGLSTCRQLTSLLMEVVTAFHLDREGTGHTFMGRGVTLSATVCLNHVAAEMRSIAPDERWITDWLYNLNHELNEAGPHRGLGWLIPLWTHTDPQVRVSSLSIIVCLTNSKEGCKIVISHIQQVARGLLGVALNFLLDHHEASIVREQASLLLVNLTCHLQVNSGSNPLEDDFWQGLIIADTEMQTPLIGIAALIALLHRSSFMHEMATLFENFSIYSTLMHYVPSQHIPHDSPSLSSCNSLTSFDFGMSHSLVIPFNHSTQNVPHPCIISGEQELEGSSSTISRIQLGATANSAKSYLVTSALSTPALVSSVCLLLRNLLILAPQDTLISIRNERIFEHLIRILEDTRHFTDKNLNGKCEMLNVTYVIDMVTSVIDLLVACCQAEPFIGMQLGQKKSIQGILLGCLSNVPIVNEAHWKLWDSAYTLLTLIVSGLGESELSLLGASISENFSILLDNLEMVLQTRSEQQVRQTVLIWLTQTCSAFYKCKINLPNSISDQPERGNHDPFSFLEQTVKEGLPHEKKAGAIIVSKLLMLHETIMHNPKSIDEADEMLLIIHALNTIVAFSSSAKTAAIEGGLINSAIQRLKRINAHINLTPEDPILEFNFSKNRESVIRDIIGHFNLLENLMYQSYDAKTSANDSDLVIVTAHFWNLAMIEKIKMLPAVLSMLCTYCAHCPPAGKSLGNPVSTIGFGQKGTPGATLLHKIVSICRQELQHKFRNVNREILELCFTLLATSSLYPACRNIIIKNKLLHCFTIEGLNKGSKHAIPNGIIQLWLKLLVNFSFKSDGQEAVFNIPDIFDILHTLASKGDLAEQEASLLILRNLCFLPSGKTKILNSAKTIATLTISAVNGYHLVQTLASSAIWELLANNQKAKTALKSEYFLHRVQDTVELLRNKENISPSEKRSLEMLQMIQSLLETT